jgi:hypothetical protein
VLKSDFGMTHPPALTRVLMDNAIVLSQNSGLDGRIGLRTPAIARERGAARLGAPAE